MTSREPILFLWGDIMTLEEKQGKGRCVIFKHLKDSEVWYYSMLSRSLWVWLLIEANHPDRHEYDGKHFVKKGQVLASYKQISRALKVKKGRGFVAPNDRTLESTLKWMKDRGMVSTLDVAEGMIITLTNYTGWNDSEVNGWDDTSDDWEDVKEDDGSYDGSAHSLSSSLSLSKSSLLKPLNPPTLTSVVRTHAPSQNDVQDVGEKEDHQKPKHPFPHIDDTPREDVNEGMEYIAHINSAIARTGIPVPSIRKRLCQIVDNVGWIRVKEIVEANTTRLQSARVPVAMLCAIAEAEPEKQPTPYHCPICHTGEFNKSRRRWPKGSPCAPDKWQDVLMYECQKCKYRELVPENERVIKPAAPKEARGVINPETLIGGINGTAISSHV